MNIKKAETDIKIAKEILAENDLSEYDYDAAAYHIQQAIEKSLKYYLSNVYGEDETRQSFKTHKIGTLLAKCYSHGISPSDFPEELLEKYAVQIVIIILACVGKNRIGIFPALFDDCRQASPRPAPHCRR